MAPLAASLPAIGQGPPGLPPARVVVDAARLETVERWREVTGELRAPMRSVLASQEAGLVLEMRVEAGDRVERGQVIARLDDRLARLEVDRSEAELETARAIIAEREAELERARLELARVEQSFSRQSASQAELDNARTGFAAGRARLQQASADLARAQSDLARAKERLSDMTIRAPFAGSVAAKMTEVGQWVTVGDPVADVVALDTLDVWLDVPESVIDRLRPRTGEGTEGAGRPVTVQIRVSALGNGGESLEAPVIGIVPTADPLSRLFPVRARLENAELRLRPGMSVVGLVPAGTLEQSVTVSKDALLRGETGTHVFYDAGGVAQIAPVSVLHAVGNRVVVRSSVLKAGASVVVEGNERLISGQPLMVRPSSGTEPEAGGGAPGG